MLKSSWNSMSPTSNFNSMLLLGVSDCPLATIIWKIGGGPFGITDRGASSHWTRHQCQSGRQWIVPQSPLGSTACVSCI